MWADDKIWLPLVLSGIKFTGAFYFDKGLKSLLRHELHLDA